MGISIPQLLIILLIVALLFGTKKLRSIGSDLGSALKGFRGAMKEDEPDLISKTESEEAESIMEEGVSNKQQQTEKKEDTV